MQTLNKSMTQYLFQSIFLQDSDLQDEAIRTTLRPLLQNPDVQDKDLIQLMNENILEEAENKVYLESFPRNKNLQLMRFMSNRKGNCRPNQETADNKM